MFQSCNRVQSFNMRMEAYIDWENISMNQAKFSSIREKIAKLQQGIVLRECLTDKPES